MGMLHEAFTHSVLLYIKKERDIGLQHVKHTCTRETEEVRETEALTLVFSVSEEENNRTSKVTLAITHTLDIKSKILI